VLKSRSATTIVVDNFHISRISVYITKMFFTLNDITMFLNHSCSVPHGVSRVQHTARRVVGPAKPV
jgi:hypothetical protein